MCVCVCVSSFPTAVCKGVWHIRLLMCVIQFWGELLENSGEAIMKRWWRWQDGPHATSGRTLKLNSGFTFPDSPDECSRWWWEYQVMFTSRHISWASFFFCAGHHTLHNSLLLWHWRLWHCSGLICAHLHSKYNLGKCKVYYMGSVNTVSTIIFNTHPSVMCIQCL